MMPSHSKPCVICGQPFAAGETRQPHPNANGIGYGKAHRRCAARYTRKGQAAATGPPRSPEAVLADAHTVEITANFSAAVARAETERVDAAIMTPEYVAQYENEPAKAAPEPEPRHRKRGKRQHE